MLSAFLWYYLLFCSHDEMFLAFSFLGKKSQTVTIQKKALELLYLHLLLSPTRSLHPELKVIQWTLSGTACFRWCLILEGICVSKLVSDLAMKRNLTVRSTKLTALQTTGVYSRVLAIIIVLIILE